MNQLNRPRLLLAGATALFLGAAAFGQAPSSSSPAAKPSQFKNLKIFPADIPREQLLPVMKTFTTSLGVKCSFCHVAAAGPAGGMDFASDANKHKDIARMMMRMERRINEQDFAVKDITRLKVTCYTCHRGAPEPLTIAPAASPAPQPAAPASAS